VASRRETTHIVEEPEGKLSVKKIALAVIALLLMVGGGAFIAIQPSTEPEATPPQATQTPQPTQTPSAVASPQPPAPRVESRVLVKVSSSPNGAAIFEGAAQIGTTPADLRLTRDQVHVLSFRLANHETVERTLDFSSLAGDTQQVQVTLSPTQVAPPPDRPRTPKPGKTQQPKDDVDVFE
jgi:serine/threonine-protein kinase